MSGSEPGHLPECIYDRRDLSAPCICDRLRACEARVREDEQRLAKYGQPVADYDNDPFYRKGHAAALDAARDAVAALSTPDDLTRQEALAAIDALRGES